MTVVPFKYAFGRKDGCDFACEQAEPLHGMSLKKMLLMFEKRVYRNQEMRIKFPDAPERSAVRLFRSCGCMAADNVTVAIMHFTVFSFVRYSEQGRI